MHVPALKAPISIERSAVFAKLVVSGRRGGWCYEQASLCAAPRPACGGCVKLACDASAGDLGQPG